MGRLSLYPVTLRGVVVMDKLAVLAVTSPFSLPSCTDIDLPGSIGEGGRGCCRQLRAVMTLTPRYFLLQYDKIVSSASSETQSQM